jgi:LPXTG-motif cell wall-anchored protein
MVWRYFVASDVNLVAVWEANAPEATVPDTTVAPTPTPTPAPELPVTGSNALNILIATFLIIVSGAFLLIPRKSKIAIPRRKV